MSGGHNSFERRVQMLERTRRKAPKGHLRMAGPDGLVFAKKRRATPTVSVRGLLYLVVGLALFKAIAMAQIGPSGYADRVAALEEGTLIEQAGAFVMQPDRISTALAVKIAPFIR